MLVNTNNPKPHTEAVFTLSTFIYQYVEAIRDYPMQNDADGY